jgi:putative hydrolase of the HAD superfamily
LLVRWIVFDYGEVISLHTTALADLAGMVGVPDADFTAAYWAARDAYDRGQSDLDFWQAVHPGVSPELVARLSEVDIAGWLHISEPTIALLEELTEAGVPMALLSNAPVSFARVAEQQEWAKHFRHLVYSGDLGMAKPDPEIWRALAEQLDAVPSDCVFFDDRQVNIDGAVAAGMTGVLWRGADSARESLVDLGVLN